jgi:hypothetical protein
MECVKSILVDCPRVNAWMDGMDSIVMQKNAPTRIFAITAIVPKIPSGLSIAFVIQAFMVEIATQVILTCTFLNVYSLVYFVPKLCVNIRNVR